ncbi:phage tail protein [Rahnella sp. FC061912-K]|uniref:gp53-like domain-containing protein n=1 Tax=Rahnella rivi TaxID=2816249 RepID=UPI001C252007|nr:phage tail protein [Rahnella rivi]MBU9832503.1 phage tail protein [Rahnella rivi]
MATNNFKPFGIGADANVIAQADYEALAALLSGFQSGKASSAQVNKAIRQGTVMASVLAQFIANASGNDVLDNGDTATLISSLIAALKANGANDFLQTLNNLVEIKNAGAPAQASARTNLGLGNVATLNTGTAAGTVATGNDSRITGSLQKASNLADVQSASSARSNLGLGSTSVTNIGTGSGMVPDMSSFTSGASGASFWQKLPSGMLMQYGYVFNMSSGAITINYPVPFASQLRSLITTPTGNVNAGSINSAVPSLNPASGTSLTAFSVTGYNAPVGGGAQVANVLFYWEAIGV